MRTYIKDLRKATVEIGDTVAHWWDHVDAMSADKLDCWHEFSPDSYGVDRGEGKRWVFLRPLSSATVTAE